MPISPTIKIAPQDITESSTRIENPQSRTVLRVLWAVAMVLLIGMFISGFVSGLKPGGWGAGCLCSETSYQIDNDQVILQTYPGGSWSTQIKSGDHLLKINGEPLPSNPTYITVTPLTLTERAGDTMIITIQTPGEDSRDISVIPTPADPVVALGMNYGLSLDAAIAYYAIFDLIVFVGFAGAALLIGWKRPDDWMALYASWTAISFGLTSSASYDMFYYEQRAFLTFLVLFRVVVFILDYNFLMIFPDGRYKPRLIAIVMVVLWSVHQAVSSIRGIITVFPNYAAYYQALNAVFLVGLMALMVYRYRRFLSVPRRQQTKWLVFSVVVALCGLQAYALIAALLDPEAWRLFEFVTYPVVQLSYLLIPLGVTFAVLRHRLWEIDLTINRSLVYGLLSLLLGAIFFLIFLVSQALLTALFGSHQAALAAAISAAGAGLCFNPAHKRVRAFVDRRIYGFRFDLNDLKKAQKPLSIANPGALTGKVVGGFELQGVLGKGAMGEVYQGIKDPLVAAIKILLPDLVDQATFVKRFEREVRVLRDLDHPNIVKIYQAGQSEGLHYIAMELIEGQDLSTVIRDRTRIAYTDLRPFIACFSDALALAHQKGLVHRDIKPSNIMLRAHHEFEPVLMDFGIARIRDASANLTGTGVMGTINYMSPEQILASSTVDTRSDIYALGVVLYEMLTGDVPFKGSVGHVLFAHLHQPPPDASQFVPDLPSGIAETIQKAMAKDVTERFQTVGELRASLEQAIDSLS